MYRILLVEDDKGLADGITALASSWGYDVVTVTDFSRVLSVFAKEAPHLVVLDISLPFFNGYHWCGEIRKVSTVPILFLSSASDNLNMVMAMNMGGDDFLAKPFDGNVLMAKISALLRRSYDFVLHTALLSHRGLILNRDDCTVTVNGTRVELSKNEYRILLCLMENKGKIVSREKLCMELWQTNQFVDDNTLTVNVTRLRKKLEAVGLGDLIETKQGQGYLIV